MGQQAVYPLCGRVLRPVQGGADPGGEKVEVTLLRGRYLAAREGSRLGRTINKNLSKELD